MKSADLRFQEKEHCCFMCFLWQSNELLIFLLLGVSSYSFRILECCSLPEHSWIVSFFPLHFLFLFSSRCLSVHVFILYAQCRLSPLLNSRLAMCSTSLHALHPPLLAVFPLYSLFSLTVFSLRHIIPLTMVLSALASFLQWFLF